MEEWPTPIKREDKEQKEQKLNVSNVVKFIETNGFNDEALELVLKWTAQKEEELENLKLSKDRKLHHEVLKAELNFNMERVDLYIASGDIDGAIQSLEENLMQAEQEGEEEIYYIIKDKLDSLYNLG